MYLFQRYGSATGKHTARGADISGCVVTELCTAAVISMGSLSRIGLKRFKTDADPLKPLDDLVTGLPFKP